MPTMDIASAAIWCHVRLPAIIVSGRLSYIHYANLPYRLDGWALGLNPFEPYPRDLESVVDLSNSVVRWLLDGVRWAHGMQDQTLAEFLDFAGKFTVEGSEDRIICHYLNMSSEGEGEAISLAREYTAKITNCASLTDRMITAEEGGDAHCGLNNPALKSQIVFA